MTKVAGCLAAALFAVATANAATILNENFNELTPAFNVTSAGIFTATSGNVDIVGAANNFGALCATPEGGNCLDLDGNTQGTISAPVTLLAGVTYALSFNLIGSGRGNTTSTTVTLDSVYNQTFSLTSGDTTTGIVVNAMVTSPATINTNLVFASNTAGAIGAVLDNVTLTSPTATPEPASALLLVPALLGLAWAGRRRMRNQAT